MRRRLRYVRAAPPAVAAQRHVQVVPEPPRQADVPAAPEVGHAGGEVRMVEVLHEPEAHDPRHPAGDVGVAGEVAVDLERKGQRAEVDRPRAEPELAVEDRVGDEGEVVRHYHLLEEAPHREVEPGHRVRPPRVPGALHLGEQVARGHDRARDHVGEKRDEQREVHGVLRGLDVAAVDVHDVADALERVERDADRQHDPQPPVGAGHPQGARAPLPPSPRRSRNT